MTARNPRRDPAERKHDGLANDAETLDRVMSSGFGKVKASELYSAVIRPPGPTTTPVSRKPGANLPGGVPVERSGATHRIAAKGEEQFPSTGGDAIITNVLNHAAFMADVHVQPGAGPDDPPVVTHPHDEPGQIPEAWRSAIGYDTSSHVSGQDGLPSDVTVTEV